MGITGNRNRKAMSVGERVLGGNLSDLAVPWEILISGKTRGARWFNLD